jgi:hypothetical protein
LVLISLSNCSTSDMIRLEQIGGLDWDIGSVQ